MAYFLLITLVLFIGLTLYELKTDKVPHRLLGIVAISFILAHFLVFNDIEQTSVRLGYALAIYVGLFLISVITRIFSAGIVNAVVICALWVQVAVFDEWMIIASILTVSGSALLLFAGKLWPEKNFNSFPLALVLFMSLAISTLLHPDFDLTPISSPEQVVAVEPAIPSLRGVN